MTSCPVCLHKDAETLDAINSAYRDEGASPEDIAVEFNIPYDIIMDHVSRCLKSGDGKVDALQDRSNDLSEKYEKLKEALDVAHLEYLTDPKASNAQGYSQLVQQFRGMVLDLQNMDSPEKMASELANDVIGPLVSRIITTLTEEFHRMREDLIKKVGAEKSKVVNTATNDTLKRVGSRLTMDQQEAIIKVQKRFNLEEDALPKKKKKRQSDAALH